MPTILAIAAKDLLLLWRDKVGLFWVLAFPLIMGFFFGSIFGRAAGGEARPIPIAVVDLDNSDQSAAFLEDLRNSDALEVRELRDPDADAPDPSSDLEIAADRVGRGALVAYVVVPEGFGSRSVFQGGALRLEVGIDPSRSAERGYLEGLLTQAVFARIVDTFVDPDEARERIATLQGDVDGWDIPPAQRLVFRSFFASVDTFLGDLDIDATTPDGGAGAFSPVEIDIEPVALKEVDGPATAYEVSFPQAMLWGLIGTAAGFAVTLVRERKQGTLLRLRVAPHGTWHVLAGKGLACFTTCALSITLLTLVANLVLDVRVPSIGLFALAVVCAATCFVGIMMLMTTLGRTEEAVAGSGWGVLLLFSMFGGGMVPLMIMPDWMLAVSNVSPVKWAIYAIEGAIWRGFGWRDMLAPCAILLAIGAVGFTVGALVFQRRQG